MALPNALTDREYEKFEEVEGKPAVRVVIAGGLAPAKYDRVDVTYPTSSSEVYDFKLDGSTVAVITLTYSNSTKNELISAVKA